MSNSDNTFSLTNLIWGALNPVTFVFGSLCGLASNLGTYLDSLHSALVSAKASGGGGSLVLLGQANTIFPVFEILTMLAALAALKVAAAVVRTVKSWIPTVS